MQNIVNPCVCFCPGTCSPSSGGSKESPESTLGLFGVCIQKKSDLSAQGNSAFGVDRVLDGYIWRLERYLKVRSQWKIGGKRKLQTVSVKWLFENTGNGCCPLKGACKVREEGTETNEWHKDREGSNLLQEIIFWAGMVRTGRGELWYRREAKEGSDHLFLLITQLMRKKAKPPVLFSLGF